MDKKLVFDMAKKEMGREINELHLNNIEQVQENMEKYFKLLAILNTLPNTEGAITNENVHEEKDSVNPLGELSSESDEDYQPKDDYLLDTTRADSESGKNTSKVTTTNETATEVREEVEESLVDVRSYKFERRLKGGVLTELGAYVPEAIIRLLGIENGNYVKAQEKETVPDQHFKHYRFEVAKKGVGKEAPGRIEIDYCLVEKDGDILVIKKSLMDGGSPIRLNDVPYSMVLKDGDVQELRLKEGDVVDVAYLESNPMYPKVIWKHDFETDQSGGSESESPIQKKRSKELKAALPEDEKKALKGKNVLVIGCEPRKTVFKQNIEGRGGAFSWAEGVEGRTRLSAMIKKADVVILLIRFIKHRASIDAVEICKENGVKFGVVKNLGVKSVIDEAITKSTA